MNLPSQKLFIFFIPIIIVSGIFVMITQHSSTNIKNSSTKTPSVVSVQNTIINSTDSDNDGVPDWEEIIWKTDPNSANTFGIPDKNYIAKKSLEQKNATTTSDSNLNATEEMSQELFAQYMALQQAGQLNDSAIETMTQRISDSIVAKPSNSPSTLKDIRTFPDGDVMKLQSYADTLVQLEKSYADQFDVQTKGKSVTLGDPDFGKSMLLASGLYTKLAHALLKIPAPQSAASFHLAYINSIKESAQGLEEFSHFTDDPLSAMVGIQRHSSGEDAQGAAINSITNFLSQNGIIGFNLTPF